MLIQKAFKIEAEIASLIEEDAKALPGNNGNASVVVRMILHRHYEDRLPKQPQAESQRVAS